MPYKHLKPFIRYDKKGNIIPASFTYRPKRPYGKYVEVTNPSSNPCCSIQVIDCSIGGYWGSHEDDLSIDNSVSFGNSVIDSDCNVYTAWGIIASESDKFFIIEKRDSSGNVLWQKSYVSDVFSSFFGYVNSLNIDLEGNLIACENYWVAKINSTTGDVIWFYRNTSLTYFNLALGSNVDSDNNVVVNGYIPIGEDPVFIDHLYVAKLDGATGALINEKYYYIDAQLETNTQPYSVPWTDSNGNIYSITGFSNTYGPGGWQGVAIKFDTNLNPVLNVKLLDKSVFLYDQDGTAIRVDANNNIYFNTYYDGVVKVSSSGSYVWGALFEEAAINYYDMAVDSSENVYMMAKFSSDTLQVVKLSATNGSLVWAINIQNTLDTVESWVKIPYVFTYYNNVLCLQNTNQVIKFSLDGIAPGTYGNLVVTDVTGSLSVTNPVAALESVTVTPFSASVWTGAFISTTMTVTDTTYTQTNTPIV